VCTDTDCDISIAWSLVSNALQHEVVFQVLEKESTGTGKIKDSQTVGAIKGIVDDIKVLQKYSPQQQKEAIQPYSIFKEPDLFVDIKQ
jgi:hypothetical protein